MGLPVSTPVVKPIIKKYYYDLVRVWYLVSWFQECPECGEFSPEPICLKCGTIKPSGEEKVTDKSIIKKLNTANPEVIEKLEKDLENEN